jgi:ABC-type transporter Mla subunit MlaD
VNKTPPNLARVLTMVVFAFSCFGLLLFLWLSFGGPIPLKPKGYRFEIGFKEATQLAVEADVRSAGVSIGKVRAKRVDPKTNRTIATIEIDRRFSPVHTDARALLRQKTLLGETFVEMTLGNEAQPIVPEGGRLPDSQIRPSVELDEILDSLDPYTRQAFRTWQRDLGSSVQGRGQDLNDSFGNLPAFAEEGGDLFEVLDEQKVALKTLVKETGSVFGALTEKEGQLKTLITAQDDVFSAIAAERESWAETFRIFPTFLDESKLTFARLGAFSEKAEPVVRDLEPAMRDLSVTLDSVGDFAPSLRRYFKNFGPLITISNRSLPAQREVFDGLDPLLDELAPFLGQLNPILGYVGQHIYTLSDMFANLGVATAAKAGKPTPGGLGHYLRQFGVTGAESAAIFPNRLAGNRGNAFPLPLGVIQGPNSPKFKVLPAWDCKNAGGEKEPGGTPSSPGCHESKTYAGKKFPQLTETSYFATK